MKRGKVSVIINCLNGYNFLEECLKSVLNQTYKNIEIIFWDNNSSDESIKLIKKFKDKGIRIFKSPKTLKLYDARNKAINKSTGEFIAFLDIDDTWHPKKTEKQLKKLRKERSDIIYNNHWLVSDKKKIFSKNKLPSKKMTYEILNNYPICISTVLLKRDVFFKIKKFNKKYEIIGDFDLFFRISKKYKFSVIQEPLVNYLSHSENTSKTKFNLRISEMYYWLKSNSNINENKMYLHLFKKMYLKNKYLESSNYIITKKYKDFFISLSKINDLKLCIKLLIKLIFYKFFK